MAEGESRGSRRLFKGGVNSELALRLIREGAPGVLWSRGVHHEGYQIFSTGAPRGDWKINVNGLVVSATLRDAWVLYEIMGSDGVDDLEYVIAELLPWISLHVNREVCEYRIRRAWPRRDQLRLTRRDGTAITMRLRRNPPPVVQA